MSRTLIARISAGVLFLTLAFVAYRQPAYTQNPPPAKLTLNKVKDDLYEVVGDGGNVAVYITDEGVILIDDKFDQDHQGIVEQVKSVTSQPSSTRTITRTTVAEIQSFCRRRRSFRPPTRERIFWSISSPT